MFGSLLGFGIGMILASFQIWGIELFVRDRLNRSVRYCSAMGPRCFRWWMQMLSGPVELLFLVDFIAVCTCSTETWKCSSSS